MRYFGKIAVVLAAVSLSGAAAAATITVTDFDESEYLARVGAGSFFGEDFESEGNAQGEGEVGSDLIVDTGRLYSLGGTGTGGTVRRLAGNTGTQLALRDGNTFGRRDTVGGRWYLDSNDTYGIGWDVSSTRLFDTVMFVLTDGSDTSGFLRILADGMTYEQRSGPRLRNGNSQLVTITFETLVDSAVIELANFNRNGSAMQRNDGFSIDGLQVGIAPVPVPPAGVLFAAGLGGLVLLRRRARN